jgi:hypothetical protein
MVFGKSGDPSPFEGITEAVKNAFSSIGKSKGKMGSSNSVSRPSEQKSEQSQKSEGIMVRARAFLKEITPDFSNMKKNFWSSSKEKTELTHRGTTFDNMQGRASGVGSRIKSIAKYLTSNTLDEEMGFAPSASTQKASPQSRTKAATGTKTGATRSREEPKKELSENDKVIVQQILKGVETLPSHGANILYEASETTNQNPNGQKIEDFDAVINTLVNRINNPDDLADMITHLSKKNIENHVGEPGNLLRGNDAASRLLQEFTTKYIVPKFATSPEFQALVNEIPNKPLVTNNSGILSVPDDQKNDIIAQANKFLEATDTVLEKNKNDPAIKAYKKICQEVSTQANKKYGKDTKGDLVGDIVAGNFLFLRFLNAALISPNDKRFNISEQKRDPIQTKNAVTISKVVTSMSNRVQFGQKEQHMTVFNDFLDQEGFKRMDELRDKLLK